MPDTCSHEGCDGHVVCVVQDVVKRRDLREGSPTHGRDVVEPDGEPKGFCREHERRYRKRRGRPIGQAEAEPELPF